MSVRERGRIEKLGIGLLQEFFRRIEERGLHDEFVALLDKLFEIDKSRDMICPPGDWTVTHLAGEFFWVYNGFGGGWGMALSWGDPRPPRNYGIHWPRCLSIAWTEEDGTGLDWCMRWGDVGEKA